MPDRRYMDPQTGKGRTAQEIADDAAGGSNPPHPATTPSIPQNTKAPPYAATPAERASRSFGAPIGKPILGGS